MTSTNLYALYTMAVGRSRAADWSRAAGGSWTAGDSRSAGRSRVAGCMVSGGGQVSGYGQLFNILDKLKYYCCGTCSIYHSNMVKTYLSPQIERGQIGLA